MMDKSDFRLFETEVKIFDTPSKLKGSTTAPKSDSDKDNTIILTTSGATVTSSNIMAAKPTAFFIIVLPAMTRFIPSERYPPMIGT